MTAHPRSARELLADYGLSEGVINGVLDIHAHELAEQQRKAIEGFDRDDHWGVLFRPDDVEGLPDLIDPQAQRASTEGDTP